jgi:LCP family protein required for cell wall assembly
VKRAKIFPGNYLMGEPGSLVKRLSHMNIPTLRTLLLIILLCLPLACSQTGIAPSPTPEPPSVGRSFLLVAPPGSTPTATPFQPVPPTPTYIPTNFPTPIPTDTPTPEPPRFVPDESRTWQDYAGPTVWPDIEVPPPTGILAHPEGQVNIMLLGSDQRPNDGGFRTDTIILLTLNPMEGTAHLTSFPRDLYVYIPGWTVQRINTAFAHGGFETLALTMEYNFGVHPDYYVMINLWSFVDVIDSLGGVDVEVGETLCDHRDGYGNYCVYQRTNFMDGETALWYVRSRYSTSDFDRGHRQQEVILAAFDKLLSLNGLQRAPELYDIYNNNVTTDMTFDQMVELLPMAVDLAGTRNFDHYFISPQQVVSWTNYSGAAVLLPIREAVLDVMHPALNSP